MSVSELDDIMAHIISAGDGLLEISNDCLRKIIRTEPISDVYHVEQTPFARSVLKKNLHKFNFIAIS